MSQWAAKQIIEKPDIYYPKLKCCLYLLFFKMCCGKFSIFYFSHQVKAAIIVHRPAPAVRTCCAVPSPAAHRSSPVWPWSHKAHLDLAKTAKWIGVCFWAVWSDGPEVDIWVFCLRPTVWPTLKIVIPCAGSSLPQKSKLIPGMCTGPCVPHPDRAAAKLPQLLLLPLLKGKHGTAAWAFEVWSVNCLVTSL